MVPRGVPLNYQYALFNGGKIQRWEGVALRSVTVRGRTRGWGCPERPWESTMPEGEGAVP